ncbi:MAG TPA: Sir2 family NAD-dependent protein deacetylase [Candidatus Xenobia bacterium]|jgi:NAD-dependent SIR2 family protein deacetylase
MPETRFAEAAQAIQQADALLITAGAGMGVDSGLPDFRGKDGFWEAYPPYRHLGLQFHELANPNWFHRDPALAWGFYGHRLSLYRSARPHPGFDILKRWADTRPRGGFVYTSNVDGQFQKAGFDADSVAECHGSIHWLQCLESCGQQPFPSTPYAVRVEETTMRAVGPFPTCPSCGCLARPNVLMFADWAWDGSQSRAQEIRLATWLDTVRGGRLVAVECGAGTAIPTVRHMGEALCSETGGMLIRINVREPQTPVRLQAMALACGAREALERLEALVG